MDEMQVKEDVYYLELMVFDSNRQIFQNLRRNFFTQKLSLLTLNSNGKNEVRKVLFINFSNKWIFNLFIFHFKKVNF